MKTFKEYFMQNTLKCKVLKIVFYFKICIVVAHERLGSPSPNGAEREGVSAPVDFSSDTTHVCPCNDRYVAFVRQIACDGLTTSHFYKVRRH